MDFHTKFKKVVEVGLENIENDRRLQNFFVYFSTDPELQPPELLLKKRVKSEVI
jgi:hypothetical protein